ncbi:NHL repeat-containing protein [Flavobacterium sp.]|uniref:NHL repeat-containing protein n=1 Tax=Flavobacterium sp. TaxID=239 RepID=UPI001B51379A|nr:T9SS type A sorting domain-containing protein [Flavobacterium sp.]MBP6126718.1 T9SS type A sorting domain-containing protein [Flavobacterium sp.]
MKKILLLILTLFTTLATAQQVTTFAGFNFSGYQDGPLQTAQFNAPDAACFDTDGNMYVADRFNHKIRKISTIGIVTTIAGSTEGFANGLGTAAQFNQPAGICIDALGNLYVADSNNNCIRKITPAGLVTTFAGSTAGFVDGFVTAAKFYYPHDICIDTLGNLYIADTFNNKIRKIATGSLIVTTLAGSTEGYLDGPSATAQFYWPWGVCVDSNFNVYVASNYRIRKITPDGMVTTYAGSSFGSADGPANIAQFRNPQSLCIDSLNIVFVVDSVSNNIRKIDADGNVTTYAGPAGMSSSGSGGDIDGYSTDARFSSPTGICIAADNSLYVLQQNYGKIRKITNVLPAESFNNTVNFTIFPNPSYNQFTITSTFPFNKVEILDLLGKPVFHQNNLLNTHTIINHNLSKGCYMVLVHFDNKTSCHKLLIN